MFSHTEKLFAGAKAAVRVPGNIRQVDVKIAVEGPIIEFQNQYFWLSNFFPTPVVMDGYTFPASENAFMSGKSEDKTWKEFCTTETNPGAMKQAGRRVKLIANWDVIRIEAMRKALEAKFSDPVLKAKLIAKIGRASCRERVS